ncbi:MAG TPA: hypothetical protein VF933_16470 [Streptosporangiaceae bacterium]
MRRLGVIVALGALLGMLAGVVTAAPAFARGPQWTFAQRGAFTLPAFFCGFGVRIAPVANKEYVKVLKTSDGSMTFLATGELKISYTNVATGKTITVNRSGPGKVTVFSDGSEFVAAKGPGGSILTPPDAQRFGLPTVSVLAGALTLTVAPDGSITSLSFHGHVLVNVCAALS